MKNKMKTTYVLTTIVCLIPLIAGLILYSRLPETVAVHWDGAGNPNGWQPKFIGVIVFPGILTLVNLLMPVLLRIDPKYKNMDSKVIQLIQWIIPLIALFAGGVTLSAAVGKSVPVQFFAPILVGFVFVLIGNYLPKTSQSYTVGIKLPWTLDSEENWHKTHRFAGRLWVVGGILTIIISLLGFGKLSFIILIAMVLVPMVYSYLEYRKEQA